MKIVVKDTSGQEFRLLATRNADGTRHASKSGTKNALLGFLKGGNNQLMTAASYEGGDSYEVGVELNRGALSIGCHSFNRAVTKTILRWLGLTTPQVVAARKIGQRVRRSA